LFPTTDSDLSSQASVAESVALPPATGAVTMSSADYSRLKQLCQERAQESRNLALVNRLNRPAKVMLGHIAGTWDRVAQSLDEEQSAGLT
jgi:hypothetical protein